MSETAFDRYENLRHAEGELDELVTDTIGGPDWWKDGAAGLPFPEWYFDPYDRSVELVGTKEGWEPTPEHLSGLEAGGICKVYVSYEGCKPDEYGKRAARMWYRDRVSGWEAGECSARVADEDTRGIVRKLKRELAAAQVLAALEAE